jgi:hypothetical protein
MVDLNCREVRVKTGFCRKRPMQTGSSETLIGWKSGKPLMALYGIKWRERGYGLRNMLGIRILPGDVWHCTMYNAMVQYRLHREGRGRCVC